MAQTQDMSLFDYVAMLRRRWRPTVAVTALVLLGTIYVAYALPATYESSATILIEQQGVPEDFVQTTVNTYAEERLQTIYQRVLAAPSVLELIDRLDLYPDQRSILPEEELVYEFRDNTLMTPQNITTVHARTGREAIVTFGFQIAFQYPDPIKARDVAAEVSNLFVSYNTELRAAAAARTTAFLDTEAAQLRQRLADVAERIADFKERHANNLPEDQGVNLQTWERLREELTQVETQLRETRERKALLETELAETPRFRPVLGESGEPVLGGVDRLAQAQQELIRLRGRYSDNHPEIINLRREIAALSSSPTNQSNLAQQLRVDLEVRRRELAAARESYSESHPDVVDLQRTISSLEQQITALNTEIELSPGGVALPNNPVYLQLLTRIATADSELTDFARLSNELDRRVQEYERQRAAAPQVEREYSTLIHEQELLLGQYRDLRTLEGEAALGEALETGQSGERLTIIEPARVPVTPVSPNRVSLSFLGVVLSIAIGLGVASLIDAADTKVRGQRDIYALMEAPPIAIIPYVESSGDTVRRLAMNFGMGALLVGGTAFVILTAIS